MSNIPNWGYKADMELIGDDELVNRFKDSETGELHLTQLFGHDPIHTSIVKAGANRVITPRMKEHKPMTDKPTLWERIKAKVSSSAKVSLEQRVQMRDAQRELNDLYWEFERAMDEINGSDEVSDKPAAMKQLMDEFIAVYQNKVNAIGTLMAGSEKSKQFMQVVETCKADVVAFVDLLNKMKAGKVLSADNYKKLEEAVALISGILAKATTEKDTGSGQTTEEDNDMGISQKDFDGLREVVKEVVNAVKGLQSLVSGVATRYKESTELLMTIVAKQLGKPVNEVRDSFKELQLPENMIFETAPISSQKPVDFASMLEKLFNNAEDPAAMALRQSTKAITDAIAAQLNVVTGKIDERMKAFETQLQQTGNSTGSQISEMEKKYAELENLRKGSNQVGDTTINPSQRQKSSELIGVDSPLADALAMG